MDDEGAAHDETISFRTVLAEGEGRPGEVGVDLAVDGEKRVSTCEIIPFRIRIGAASVRMDGIGGVGTRETHRRRGLARRVLDAAITRMQAGDAALSMLYGIPDFYPKFGYATAGPNYGIRMDSVAPDVELPEGWSVRAAVNGDQPALERLYNLNTEQAVGAAVRDSHTFPWTTLPTSLEEPGIEECRLVRRPDGHVAAYAWRGRQFWAAKVLQQEYPDSLVLSEVMAEGPQAADVALQACRRWATEEASLRGKPVTTITLALPPEGHVASAAMREEALFWQRYRRCSDSMARVLHVGRLFEAMRPELDIRRRTSLPGFTGEVLIETDIGGARLVVTADALAIEGDLALGRSEGHQRKAVAIRLPQTALAQLALGAFPPGDVLGRLEQPVDGRAREVVEALFPQRHPHMFVPDRY